MDRLRNFGFLLRDVARLSSKNFERHAGGLGLTVAQCKVLGYLHRHEGISQIRLAELTDTDPMTLVRLLDRMEQDGWIERRAHPSDRRARQLFLKPAARPIIERMWQVAERARAKALTGLSGADREQLMGLLERVHANLVALADAPAAAPARTARRRRARA